MTDERLADALADRYLLEEELGRGASATVYLAQDLRHGRRVALKVLHSALGAALGVERFQREIRTQARLHHPHILPLFDSGSAAGRLYYVMPYVETGSLRDRLRGQGRLGVGAAVQLGREVASALSYAHALGVIHRDLKPENIVFSPMGHAILADFGIAYALEGARGPAAHRDRRGGRHAGVHEPRAVGGRRDAGRPERPVRAGRRGVRNARRLAALHRPQRPRHLRPEADRAGPAAHRPPAGRAAWPWSGCCSARSSARATRATRRSTSSPPRWSMRRGRRPGPRFPAPSPPSRPCGRPARCRGGRRLAVLVAGLLLVVAAGIAWGMRRMADRAAAERAAGPRVVAVLPFKNLGPPGDQYFADGLTEEITSRLAGLSGLRVISRTSADQYRTSAQSVRAIGAELGADYVLEGSVRWARDSGGVGRLRVTPQLIRVGDDSHLWAATYEAALGEVFRLQSEIAERVTTALDVALRAPERAALAAVGTRNPEAYDFYLRGNEYVGRGTERSDVLAAIDLYQRAVGLDSTFAAALAKLARAEAAMYWFYYDHSPGRLARAKRAADAAVRFGPDLAEARVALGYYYYWGTPGLRSRAARVRGRAAPPAQQQRRPGRDRLRRSAGAGIGTRRSRGSARRSRSIPCRSSAPSTWATPT